MSHDTRQPSAIRLALRDRRIRRLEGALLATAIGSPLYALALAVWAYATGGAAMLSAVALGTMLPAGLLAPVLAALADRFPPGRVLVAALLARGATLAALSACLAHGAGPASVVALASLASLASRVVFPAVAAVTPAIARNPAELVAMNALSSCIDNAGAVAAPAVAGAALAFLNPGTVVLGAALAALLAALLARACAPETAITADVPAGPRRDVVLGGLRAVRRDRRLRAIIAVLATHAFAYGMLSTLVVIIASERVGLGGAGVGLLEGALGGGAIAGGLLALRATRARGLRGTTLAATAAWAGMALAAALLAHPVAAVVILAGMGAAASAADVSATSLLQRECPSGVVARVFGLLEGVAVGATAAGGALAPLLAVRLGTPFALAGLALALALGARAAARLAPEPPAIARDANAAGAARPA